MEVPPKWILLSLSVYTWSQGPTESPKLSPRSSRNPWVVLKHPDICSNLIPDVQRESCVKVISCSKHRRDLLHWVLLRSPDHLPWESKSGRATSVKFRIRLKTIQLHYSEVQAMTQKSPSHCQACRNEWLENSRMNESAQKSTLSVSRQVLLKSCELVINSPYNLPCRSC